jgi:hypothetical protein
MARSGLYLVVPGLLAPPPPHKKRTIKVGRVYVVVFALLRRVVS